GIVAVVAGRRPISAAVGELAEGPPLVSVQGVCFAKLGLAGCSTSWRAALRRHRQRLKAWCCELVPVAYADWQRAQAPPLQQIADFAREENAPAWLIDTWCKDGSTLLDWLDVATLAELRDRATVPLALAGSLTWREMRRLLPVRPTWFAVRTAVCRGGDRQGPIDADRVRALTRLLARIRDETSPPAPLGVGPAPR
ncbi:MAG: (5-formylfuran-3-yl)methyl phosphate synthase, partial [Gemmataceae bacterium]|nr:(5-formylfuran-3-yl)methyl phosphate synthase [Gemmataceae bacterium]MDW8266709.1 (5-formylfuran-3-yl)methyl phosphate synthase [Gemmataceae bacterium]